MCANLLDTFSRISQHTAVQTLCGCSFFVAAAIPYTTSHNDWCASLLLRADVVSATSLVAVGEVSQFSMNAVTSSGFLSIQCRPVNLTNGAIPSTISSVMLLCSVSAWYCSAKQTRENINQKPTTTTKSTLSLLGASPTCSCSGATIGNNRGWRLSIAFVYASLHVRRNYSKETPLSTIDLILRVQLRVF